MFFLLRKNFFKLFKANTRGCRIINKKCHLDKSLFTNCVNSNTKICIIIYKAVSLLPNLEKTRLINQPLPFVFIPIFISGCLRSELLSFFRICFFAFCFCLQFFISIPCQCEISSNPCYESCNSVKL